MPLLHGGGLLGPVAGVWLRTLATLGVVGWAFLPTACKAHCGEQPPTFAALGPVGAWDPNKTRSSKDEIATYCRDTYRPCLEAIHKAGNKFSLPSVNLQQGVVSLAGGVVHIGQERAMKYAQLSLVDLALVQTQIANCSTAQTDYECVIFARPEDHPEMQAQKYLLERILAAAAVQAATARFEQARSNRDSAEAGEALKKALDDAPTPPRSSVPGASMEPTESRLRFVEDVLAAQAAMLAGEQKRVENLSREVAVLRSSAETLRVQSGLLASTLAANVNALGQWATCRTAWNRELEVVRSQRASIRNALGGAANFDAEELYAPIVAEVAGADFAVCDATVPPATVAALHGVGAAIRVLARGPRKLVVTVEGFSDQQPIVDDGNRARCKAHGFSNAILAEHRARAVWDAVVADVGQVGDVVKAAVIGHEDRFLKNCYAESVPAGIAACHAANRRFRLALEGPAVTPVVPPECRALASTAASTP